VDNSASRVILPFSTSRKCTWKVHFNKPCSSAASESEFNRPIRILHLKVGMLVFKESRLSKYQGCSLVAYLFNSLLRLAVACCCGKQNAHAFFVLRHTLCRVMFERGHTSMGPKLLLELLAFFCSRDHV